MDDHDEMHDKKASEKREKSIPALDGIPVLDFSHAKIDDLALRGVILES